jgi:hypothetical protein
MEALGPSRLGHVAGNTVAALTAAYAVVLAIGLLTLPSPEHPIRDPWFTLMEVLILAIAPAAVALSVGLHAALPQVAKPSAALAVIFMSMCAVTTSVVHFSMLALARIEPFASASWAPLVFGFRWPSVAYALDVLAWDVFFAGGCMFTAMALRNVAGATLVRVLMVAAAALSFIGVFGVFLANMAVRNIGIVGYVIVYPVAAALLSRGLRPLGRAEGAA